MAFACRLLDPDHVIIFMSDNGQLLTPKRICRRTRVLLLPMIPIGGLGYSYSSIVTELLVRPLVGPQRAGAEIQHRCLTTDTPRRRAALGARQALRDQVCACGHT